MPDDDQSIIINPFYCDFENIFYSGLVLYTKHDRVKKSPKELGPYIKKDTDNEKQILDFTSMQTV